jgi:hypothetical protein
MMVLPKKIIVLDVWSKHLSFRFCVVERAFAVISMLRWSDGNNRNMVKQELNSL